MLNAVLHFGFAMLLKQSAKEKKMIRKKTEEKQNSITIMMSIDGKGTVFLVKLTLKGELFE